MKENPGYAKRRRLLKKIGFVVTIFLVLIVGLYLLDQQQQSGSYSSSSLELVDDRVVDAGNNNYKPSLFNRLRRRQGGKKPTLQDSQVYERVLSGELILVDIEASTRELQRSSAGTYEGVIGTFCKVNFQVHKKDPSSVPMFRDVLQHSTKCEKTKVRVPLKEIATLAREMDQENQRQPTSTEVPKPLNLTGVVFHESRCGSTLVANTLISANPEQHRVFSESPPPVTAMKLCGDNYETCSLDQAAMILRDTLYMMGRTNDPKEERLFFKIQSVGSRHIEVFRRAFPNTPWIFVYREPVQVMMSHLAQGYKRANCLRSLHRPPAITNQIAKRHGHATTSELSPEQFCAAHLATITESALANLQQSQGKGVAVNYETLPDHLYSTILPHHMGVTMNRQSVDRIKEISGKYSKGRGDRNKEWKEDSEKKEQMASKAIKDAAQQFLMESYQALQELQS